MLGGLTPQQFMRRHWQKAPLLVRQAFPGFRPLLPRAELMALAARDDVQSRLVLRDASRGGPGWQLRHGPFARRALPSLRTPDWTLLVQGVDLLDDRVQPFREVFQGYELLAYLTDHCCEGSACGDATCAVTDGSAPACNC